MTTHPEPSHEVAGWERDLMCVLDGYITCAAKAPIACICRQMPPSVYEEAWRSKFGVQLARLDDV